MSVPAPHLQGQRTIYKAPSLISRQVEEVQEMAYHDTPPGEKLSAFGQTEIPGPRDPSFWLIAES
jgi:hypothetical protein